MPSRGPLVVSERQKHTDDNSHIVVVLLQELLIQLAITEAHLHQALLTGGRRTTRRPGDFMHWGSILYMEKGENIIKMTG